jgi:non-ribosomal peptide synthetase component F
MTDQERQVIPEPAPKAARTTLKSVDTLLDVLQFADSHTAIVIPEFQIRVTYDSLRQQVLRMANALAAAGIRRGDAVAIALPNGLPAIVSFLAASIAGTAAPLNPAYPYEEFLFFLADTDARVLLCPPAGAEYARTAALDRKIPVFPVEMSEQGSVHLVGGTTGGSATEPKADDIALILHTSGSTGRPKRVPLRHFNLAVSSANIANTYALSAEDVSLCIMPLFHVHGLIGSTLSTLLSGGTVVVPSKFNALSFWRTSRYLVFRRADDAPASSRSQPAETGGSRFPAIYPFLQRSALTSAHQQNRGAVWSAVCRSLRNDRGCAPDDLESPAAATPEGWLGWRGRGSAHRHHGPGGQSSGH